jgi:hypothetical protein
MRYRRLTSTELEALQGDFVQFLAESSIPADEWLRWQVEAPERMEAVLDAFSEAFWERACSRITHLKRDAGDAVWWFEFGETEALAFCIPGEVNERPGGAQAYQAKRSYPVGLRNQAIFQLLEQSAVPCEPEAFAQVQSTLQNPIS